MKKIMLLLIVSLFLIWQGLNISLFPFNIILPAIGGFWFGTAIRESEKIKNLNEKRRIKFNKMISEMLNKVNI